MLSIIHSAGLIGIEAYPLEVEVDICKKSFPQWNTVGLPDSEVKESKQRVTSAILNSGFDFTKRKITINLAPADLKKEGTGLDLPIAMGLLASSEVIPVDRLARYLCIGELSLNGKLRPVRGILPIAILCKKKGYEGLILPKDNAEEASVVEGLSVFAVSTLTETISLLSGTSEMKPIPTRLFQNTQPVYEMDYSEISGQYMAKRALEIAASGGHNLLFRGPPGSGKTMLASRLSTILPPFQFEEALETSQIYSVVNLLRNQGLLTSRPFRSPHHSISDAGMIGGGSIPKPGEVSLAHHGVLFLDELPEFRKYVLELLRQPLESGSVTICRAQASLTFPAEFMLVASMNNCPCGRLGHPKLSCACTQVQVSRYQAKISGPLLDRIDLHVDVPPVPFHEIASPQKNQESSGAIRSRVLEARAIQKQRFEALGLRTNAQMGPKLIRRFCAVDSDGLNILKGMMEKFHFSARAYHRILKVARTLADMEARPSIEMQHLMEAIQFRALERT